MNGVVSQARRSSFSRLRRKPSTKNDRGALNASVTAS